MRKIDLQLEQVSDTEVLNKILKIIKSPEEEM
jgi:hypothetical protein